MRDQVRIGRSFAALAVAVATGACSDSTGPEALDAAISYDMAILAADATLEDVTMWSLPFGFGPSLLPGPPGGHGGWSGDRSGTRQVTFYDGSGVEQPAYDSLTTASIHIVHEIDGEHSR